MKANLHNPNPLRAPLAVLGLCSLCLAIQFTYAQEDVSSDSALITEVPSQAPAPLSELPQDSVPTPSADSIPLAPASPPVPPRPPIQQLPRVSVEEDRNVEITPQIPKTEIRFSDEELHLRSPEGELHFEGPEAEMHRALAKMQKELSKTQRELGRLQKELARARAEKDHFNREQMSFNINENKEEDWLRSERAVATKDRAWAEAESAMPDSKDALKSRFFKEAAPKSRTLQTGAKALQEQQRLLQETITQAVTEALRAATEEIRKEFQEKAPSSSTGTIESGN